MSAPKTKLETLVPLKSITSAHNSRNPVPNLVGAGICSNPLEPGDAPMPLDLVQELALSDDPDKRAKFVALIDEHESGGLESIKSLAEGGAKVPGLKDEHLQAVALSAYRIKQVDENGKRIVRYRIILGERRIIAMAYLFAKYGKEYDSIRANVVRATVDKAHNMGIAENFLRRNPSPSEVAHTYKSLKAEGMSIADIAEMFFSDNPRKTQSAAYQEVRSMLKLVTGKSKLTPERLQALDNGDIGLTKAKKEAGGLGVAEGKKYERRRTVGIRKAEELLDNAVRGLDALEADAQDEGIAGYIEACADFMQYETIEEAIADSRVRIAGQVEEGQQAPVEEAA